MSKLGRLAKPTLGEFFFLGGGSFLKKMSIPGDGLCSRRSSCFNATNSHVKKTGNNRNNEATFCLPRPPRAVCFVKVVLDKKTPPHRRFFFCDGFMFFGGFFGGTLDLWPLWIILGPVNPLSIRLNP